MERPIYAEVKYKFTPEEKRQLGEAIAREEQGIRKLQAERKSVAAALAAQIETATLKISNLADQINNGWEMREVECRAAYDTPIPGMKQIRQAANDEWVRDEPMT